MLYTFHEVLFLAGPSIHWIDSLWGVLKKDGRQGEAKWKIQEIFSVWMCISRLGSYRFYVWAGHKPEILNAPRNTFAGLFISVFHKWGRVYVEILEDVLNGNGGTPEKKSWFKVIINLFQVGWHYPDQSQFPTQTKSKMWLIQDERCRSLNQAAMPDLNHWNRT